MDFNKKEYKKYVDEHSPKSPIVKNCFFAFIVGGLICAAAQGIRMLFEYFGFGSDSAGTWTSVILVLITAILTGLGIFDRIARFAGAGTLVPITGFANAVTSQAIDAKSEGYVLGVGAKIFTVAGPVLLYGTVAGTLYGFIYWLFNIIS